MDPLTIGIGLALMASILGSSRNAVSSSHPVGIPENEWNFEVKQTLGRLLLAESSANDKDWQIIPFALRRQYITRRAGDVRARRTPRTFLGQMRAYSQGLRTPPEQWSARQRTIFTMPYAQLPARIREIVDAFEGNTLNDIAPEALDWGAPGFRSQGRERTATNLRTENWYYTGRRA